MKPHESTPAGIVLPRYMKNGTTDVVMADRIERAEHHDVLRLASGQRVIFPVADLHLDFPLIGAFFVDNDGDGEVLSAGVFHSSYTAVPQGTDIPAVSAALDVKPVDPDAPAPVAEPAPEAHD